MLAGAMGFGTTVVLIDAFLLITTLLALRPPDTGRTRLS